MIRSLPSFGTVIKQSVERTLQINLTGNYENLQLDTDEKTLESGMGGTS